MRQEQSVQRSVVVFNDLLLGEPRSTPTPGALAHLIELGRFAVEALAPPVSAFYTGVVLVGVLLFVREFVGHLHILPENLT